MAAQKFWFKARGKSSVGWVPVTWQGWVVLLLYIGLLIHSYLQINAQSPSLNETFINFIPRFLLFTAILTVVTYLTGETITWHHEKPLKESDPDKD